jgi:hypothetical protein
LAKALNLIICLHELCIFLEFAFALDLVDIAKEDISQPFAASRLLLEYFHRLLVPPVAIPAVSDVLVGGNVP